jgi:shikimate kinase
MSSGCNYILINLANINIKTLSLSLSEKLGYYYLNVEDLIDYSLFDKEKMIDVCGIDYMEREKKKVINSINGYEKSITSMNYETFSNNVENINKNNKIIYLNIDKNQLQEELNKLKQKRVTAKNSNMIANITKALIVFEEREKFIRKNCDIEVKYDISNIGETVNSIYKIINK